MQIIEYDERYKQDFIDFNSTWIIDNFGHLEPEDLETFEKISVRFQNGTCKMRFLIHNGEVKMNRIQ